MTSGVAVVSSSPRLGISFAIASRMIGSASLRAASGSSSWVRAIFTSPGWPGTHAQVFTGRKSNVLS